MCKGKGKCERPCWTIFFILIWILVVPGVLLTHASLAVLLPPIKDLPANIAKGFDEVFRFAYLKADSQNIQTSSADVLKKCQVTTPEVTCPVQSSWPSPTLPAQQANVDTTAEKAVIVKAFSDSLNVVRRVANDKYFGTKELNETATNLNKLTAELDKINPSMPCYQAVPAFCSMYEASDGIVQGMGEVDKALNAFKESEMVQRWDDHVGLLTFMHALPWLLVIGMVAFSFFWLRGGVCCCCKGGTKTGFCLIPYVLFWLLSFIVYLIVCAVGLGIKYMSNRLTVPVLKGEPTLDLAIDHIQTDYPKFWEVVFADLVKGLDLLLNSSFFFVAAALLIMLYSTLMCCCCPYRKKGED